MNELPKDKKIDELNENLDQINYKLGNFWYSFVKGLLSGLGSVLGAGLAIIIIGWFLNIVGIIPAFQKQANDWKDAFKQTQNDKTFIQDTNQ